jgi:hypothetical protein
MEYVDPGETGRRLLAIGRRVPDSFGWTPLAVDLDTKRVSVFPVPFDGLGSYLKGRNVLSVDGRILVAKTGSIVCWLPPEGPDGRWTFRVVAKPGVQKYGNTLLPLAGAIYCGGTTWSRIDPQTLECEVLTTKHFPQYWRFPGLAVSAHYGLVAWKPGGPLHRVLIDPETWPEADPDVRYAYVPAAYRERHRQAAEAIRALGGMVGPCNTIDRGQGTRVYLSSRWTGGDEGFKHVDALYKPLLFKFVQAPITDEALRILARRRSVYWVDLVETNVTDEGLKYLEDTGLKELRLQGTPGNPQFTDACLESVRRAGPVRSLVLYGPGFTDAAVEQLKQMHHLWHLRLQDTRISDAGYSELRKARPDIKSISRR